MTYISRHIEQILREMLEQFKVVLITGPRQVGKTTMLKHSLPNYDYVTLDDMSELSLAKTDPALFFKNHRFPIIIDEVQYAPELFRYIKLLCDQTDLKGQICLTGSQTYHLMHNVSESLAGRIGILEMQGFSLRELYDISYTDPFIPTDDQLMNRGKCLKSYDHIWKNIQHGSMPALSDKQMNWSYYYQSYVKSYIERDVRNLMNIKDAQLFYKFMIALAARTGSLFNANDIANTIDVSLKTVQSWISILEASGIIFFLRPYENNLLKRVVKKNKIYFYDTGLICYLIGWDNEKVLQNGAMSGAIFETFIISEIAKSYLNRGQNLQSLFFYRDNNQKEIDLIIAKADQVYPIEIKVSSTPSTSMGKNFSVLKHTDNVHIHPGTILCLSDRQFWLKSDLQSLAIDYV